MHSCLPSANSLSVYVGVYLAVPYADGLSMCKGVYLIDTCSAVCLCVGACQGGDCASLRAHEGHGRFDWQGRSVRECLQD